MNKVLCFKQTRSIHESGFRYIEYGYMANSNDESETVEVIGRYDLVRSYYTLPLQVHIDLTRSGWFRILSDKNLEWGYGGEIKEVEV